MPSAPLSADIDIVIVNYRSIADTLVAIDLLAPWRFATLWIVDNSDDRGEAARLREATAHLPWVRLIVAERNLGFGNACNLAFEHSRTPFFMLLNPDARISPDDIAKLADALRDDPGWAGVSPKTYWDPRRKFLLPTAYPQSPGRMLADLLMTRSRRLARSAFHRYLAAQQACMAGQATFPTDCVAGALLMLRRQAVLAAGGLFDPGYFMFYEDSQLSLRLRRAGFRLGIAPQAEAVHEYRHKALKAPLMEASRLIYYRQCFPRFFRLSGELQRLNALAGPIDWTTWSTLLPNPPGSAQAFQAAFPGSHIVAFSPNPLLMPAIFRPAGAPPACLDESDWNLLEPGHYMVALRSGTADAPLRFVAFERTTPLP